MSDEDDQAPVTMAEAVEALIDEHYRIRSSQEAIQAAGHQATFDPRQVRRAEVFLHTARMLQAIEPVREQVRALIKGQGNVGR